MSSALHQEDLPAVSQEWLAEAVRARPSFVEQVNDYMLQLQLNRDHKRSACLTLFDLLDGPVRFLDALGIDPNEEMDFRCIIDNKENQREYQRVRGFYGGRSLRGSYFELMFQLFQLNVGDRTHNLVKDSFGLWVKEPVPNPEPPRGVYFTVNISDGEGQSAHNIEDTRAVFVDDDTDSVDLEELFADCEPSAVVRSRNGVHVYWRTSDLELEDFEPAQKALARKLGTDGSVHDLARIMRMPGFFHQKQKRDPFLVTLEHADPDEFSIQDIFDDLDIEMLDEDVARARAREYRGPAPKGGAQPTPEMIADVSRLPKFTSALARVSGSTPGGEDGAETSRHHQTFVAGATAHDYGLSKQEALPYLLEWNAEKNTPPLDPEDVKYQLDSAYRYARGVFGEKLNGQREHNAIIDAMVARLEQTASGSDMPAPSRLDPVSDVVSIPAADYVGQHIKLEPDTVYLLACPHGKGKTWLGRQMIEASKTALFISPTVALSVAGSEVMGIPCYTDGLNVESKISTTMNSLPNLTDPEDGYAAVMVDEIDQCLDYVQSGRVPNALSAVSKMWACVANASNAILASADFTDEYMTQAIRNIRKHAPGKRIVVVRQQGEEGRVVLDVMGVPESKAEMRREIVNHVKGDAPYVIFCTGKEWAQKMAQMAGTLRPDLSVLAISSENSRLDEVQDMLRSPDSMLEDYDILVLSPAVKSGVSFTKPVRKVHVHHTCRDVTAETMCQMPMRARNLLDPNVCYGMTDFDIRDLETDAEHLRNVAVRTAEFTDSRILSHLPDFRASYEDGNQPLDPLFTAQWCLTEKRSRLSYNNPLKRLGEVARYHNWGIHTYKLGRKPSGAQLGHAKAFNMDFSQAAATVDEERAEDIASAEVVDGDDLRKIQRKSRLTEDEQNQMRKAEVREYYGIGLLDEETAKEMQKADTRLVVRDTKLAEAATPEELLMLARHDAELNLIHKDDRGKYREACRQYNRVFLASGEARGDLHARMLLGMIDMDANRGRQKTEYRHHGSKAWLLHQLFAYVSGLKEFGQGFRLAASVIRARAWSFYQMNYLAFVDFFKSKLRSDKQAVRWFNSMMKKCGVTTETLTHGNERVYLYDFAEVHRYAEYERQCLDKRLQDMKSQKALETLLDGLRTAGGSSARPNSRPGTTAVTRAAGGSGPSNTSKAFLTHPAQALRMAPSATTT